MRLGTGLAIDAGDVDVELQVLRAVVRGEALAMEDEPARVAVVERHVRHGARQDAHRPATFAAQHLDERRRARGGRAERHRYARLVHRVLHGVGDERQVRGRQRPRERRRAPREPERDVASGAALALDPGRAVANADVVDAIERQQRELAAPGRPRPLHRRGPVGRNEVDGLAPVERQRGVERGQRPRVGARLPDRRAVGAAAAGRHHDLVPLDAP